jgi:hypothetical protein
MRAEHGRWLFVCMLLVYLLPYLLTMHGRVFSDSRFQLMQIEMFAVTFWASTFLPIAVATMLWCIYQIAVASSGKVERGLQAVLVIGLATNTWFYATTFWAGCTS